MKVLISAFACNPYMGSESGLGWKLSNAISKYHKVWIITRSGNRNSIESFLTGKKDPNLQFIYYNLPIWKHFPERSKLLVHLYYRLWQFGAFIKVKKYNKIIKFDIVHHITYGQYWSTIFMPLLPIPFIWGPIGGGESTPMAFINNLHFTGRIFEYLRIIGRWFGDMDPFVRKTAKKSSYAIAATQETRDRIQSLGVRNSIILSHVAVDKSDTITKPRPKIKNKIFRLISTGSLIHWKGHHLTIEAFGKVCLENWELWIVGKGRELKNLENLVKKLNINDKVIFLGWQPSRRKVLEQLCRADVFVYPSLHESGGMVCVEAMANSLPIICLNLGGPSILVNDKTGIKIDALNPKQAVHKLGKAMQFLYNEEEIRINMGNEAYNRVFSEITWDNMAKTISDLYEKSIEV